MLLSEIASKRRSTNIAIGRNEYNLICKSAPTPFPNNCPIYSLKYTLILENSFCINSIGFENSIPSLTPGAPSLYATKYELATPSQVKLANNEIPIIIMLVSTCSFLVLYFSFGKSNISPTNGKYTILHNEIITDKTP